MQKIQTHLLKIGMKVVKLDRPWLETPYILHKFTIKSEKKIISLRNLCDFVYIDSNVNCRYKRTENDSFMSEKERVAHKKIQLSFKLLNLVFSDFSKNAYIDSYKIQLVVNNLVLQVLADNNTYSYLNIIKSNAPTIAQKSVRVLILYITLCKYLGIKKDKLCELGSAALLHDIGMIKLPIYFDKAEKLSKKEIVNLHKHTYIGAALIRKSGAFSDFVSDVIASHHEHYNGGGYPCGLSHRNINIYSRMLTVICTYEALTRDRYYKKAVDTYSALTELNKVSGTILDPRLVGKFIELIGVFPENIRVKTSQGLNVKVIKKLPHDLYEVTNTLKEKSVIIKTDGKTEVYIG
ncbi:MAG: putative nucleotidyltransferase with HDIG domain [Colwellia sp.]|jgi:putative nucleotidyltransferase with HDIG domain